MCDVHEIELYHFVTFIRINLQQKREGEREREREREDDAQTSPVFYSLCVNLILFV